MPAKLLVSIVTYNSNPGELAASIRSAHRTRHSHEVVVVDNSPDASLAPVVAAAGGVYRKLPRNLGFGAAHNLALRDALGRASYCLVLNPDCSFEAGVLDELMEFLDENDDVGLVMPRVLSPDGSEQRLCKLLPAPSDLVLRRFGGRRLQSAQAQAMRRFECGRMDLSTPMNVPYLSGCFMLMRTAALERVGLFDERIFMYLEDLDLCRRLHREFATIFYPYVGITHRHERGSYSDGRLLRAHVRSSLYYFSKYGWFFDKERQVINKEVERQQNGRWGKASVLPAGQAGKNRAQPAN